MAEQIVLDAAEEPRNDRTDLLVLLVPIYSQIGRADEAEQLLEGRWEHSEPNGRRDARAIHQARPRAYRIDLEGPLGRKSPCLPRPGRTDGSRRRPRAGSVVPIWRSEQVRLEEAEKWLDACQRRRPDDVPVWHARLSWGLAARRLDVVENALKHLPAADSTPAQVHRLNAWLAEHRGDLGSERRELERLIAVDPADLTALDRLARLAEKDRQPAYAAELLRKKAEIDRTACVATRNCTNGHNTCVTPRRWPGWPSDSGAGSRPGFSHRGHWGGARARGPAP